MQSIELVTFRLNPGTDRAAFLENARRTEAVVRRQPGFQSRLLTEGEDGAWSEIVTWASHAEAMAAAGILRAGPEFAPLGAMIAEPTVTMSYSALGWQMA